jgi:hypothetical protein
MVLEEERKCTEGSALCALLGTDVLQSLWAVQEVVGISLGDDFALVGLLDKVLVALLVGKVDGIVL